MLCANIGVADGNICVDKADWIAIWDVWQHKHKHKHKPRSLKKNQIPLLSICDSEGNQCVYHITAVSCKGPTT